MKVAEVNFWGIHGGRTGDADSLFFQRNCVAIRWQYVPEPIEPEDE